MAEYYCPKPSCWGFAGPALYDRADLLVKHLRAMHGTDSDEQWVREHLNTDTLDD